MTKAFDVLVLKYQHKVANPDLALHPRFLGGVGRDPGGIHQGLPGVAEVPWRQCVLYLALSGGDQYGKNHLAAQARRPPGDDIEAETAGTDGHGGGAEGDGRRKISRWNARLRRRSAALDGLPDDLRTAITLRELGGPDLREIAQAMDCPMGTVLADFQGARAIDVKMKPLLAPCKRIWLMNNKHDELISALLDDELDHDASQRAISSDCWIPGRMDWNGCTLPPDRRRDAR